MTSKNCAPLTHWEFALYVSPSQFSLLTHLIYIWVFSALGGDISYWLLNSYFDLFGALVREMSTSLFLDKYYYRLSNMEDDDFSKEMPNYQNSGWTFSWPILMTFHLYQNLFFPFLPIYFHKNISLFHQSHLRGNIFGLSNNQWEGKR